MRVAIIGAGISAIAFGGVLRKFGHECVLFEKAARVGGIWALAYPQVRLQNTREQYTFIDFPWPKTPDQHPTAAQILEYLDAAVRHFALDVRLKHTVKATAERGDGWLVTVERDGETQTFEFDYVIVSIGQYAEEKYRPEFPNEADFSGQIVTERDVQDLELFRGQRVAVVGFGKSAVDMVSFAAPLARSVAHVFRTPRWLIPYHLLGLHYSYALFSRASTIFMPSWVHAGAIERWIHRRASWLVRGFWKTLECVVRRHIASHSHAPGARARLAEITPDHPFAGDLRSATAMAPTPYFGLIADGSAAPYRSEIECFSKQGLILTDGREVEADLVVLSVGSGTPVFPFLPDHYRAILEQEDDGIQLYRHLLHPSIQNLAFAGYNHGFMHVPSAELGALWLCAVWRGDILLPSSESQLASIERIRTWKRDNVQYEPSRSCAVSTRFQQYIDALLIDLNQPTLRKLPNIFAEFFARYGGADYAGIVQTVRDRPPVPPRVAREFDA